MGWFGFKKMLAFTALGAMLAGTSVSAQMLGRRCNDCAPSCGAPSCGSEGCTVPTDGSSPDIDSTSMASDFGSSSGPESSAPHMIGDMFSGLHYFSSQGPSPNGTRMFKFAENQSAAPVNRWYFNSTSWNDVGASGGGQTDITRWTIGKETVIGDGNTSIGFRVPFYFVDPGAAGGFSAGTADRGAFGDLTLLFKSALINNGGDVLSGGIGYTIPTGPGTIGGVPSPTPAGVAPQHDGSVQPFIAGIRQLGGGVFFQGFTALDVPIDNTDSILWLNDFQIGFVARTYADSGVTAIVPLMEVHSNSPWNRTLATGAGYFSTLNITTGVTFEFNRSSTLALGLVCPIQDNHTFDYEFQAQFNVFGGY